MITFSCGLSQSWECDCHCALNYSTLRNHIMVTWLEQKWKIGPEKERHLNAVKKAVQALWEEDREACHPSGGEDKH